jgi:hypothetical protein
MLAYLFHPVKIIKIIGIRVWAMTLILHDPGFNSIKTKIIQSSRF